MTLAADIAKVLVPDGKIQVWELPIAVSTTPYTAADAVGGIIVLPAASRTKVGGGAIVSMTVVDLADQAAALQLGLFNVPFIPTADNAPIAISDADALNCVGVLLIATTDYSDFGGFQVASAKNQWLGYQCLDGNLYGQLKTTGTPTYGLAELKLRVIAIWD